MSSIKFAIFTDTHLGHEERDPVRGKDSFDAFEEALQISLDEKVDCIIHAGDMFDEPSPTRSTMIKTNEILHKYLFRIPNEESQGENAIKYEDTEGLTEKIPTTLDENIHVKVPFFVIHGNHDPPSGFELTSACDLLSSCRLVNYFKKIIDPATIELKPVILQRANIEIALYGLGYIMETKFITALESKSITFAHPPEDTDPTKKRFSILLLHQNRPSRNSQQLQVPHMLRDVCPWMDLIVWGHEHENRTDMEISCGMRITQPGSTIVTMLRDFEATPRGMAILEVFEDHEDFIPINLKTPRPFIISKLELDSSLTTKPAEEVLGIIREKLIDMIDQRDDRDKIPIIRLHVFAAIDMRNVPYKQLTHEFSQQVANPHNFIEISRRSTRSSGNKDKKSLSQSSSLNSEENEEFDVTTSPTCIEELLEKKFEDSPLDFLIVDTLNQSLKSYVFEEDRDAFNRNIKDLIETRVSYLLKQVPDTGKGMSPEDAADFIELKRNDLPGINTSKSQRHFLSSTDSTATGTATASQDSDDEDFNKKSQQKNKRTRKTKTVDEPVEDEPAPTRQRMPRKVRAPPSLKKSVMK
ncbi:Ser/Thr protein phosphatase [Tritrichomonas foetus]|uniref:Ser/Thr protein phosphatase n=1 Tax=Tritrichomonas foetus TaxID=1144522 RepID=A0A1J4L6F0_9EUKA|nr:Ser/Thr protein phosphatase [Tritrichomonas foetus]|eukprot:OHT17588.1 Ser/Thr protein phosphatase [Tritrichomonas foetus]